MAVLTKSRATVLAAALGALLTTACDRSVIELRDDLYAVHALLVAGTDSARVLVTRNDPRVAHGLGEEGVGSAVVRLIHGGDTLTLDELPAHPDVPGPSGEYAALVPGGIVPGERYELVVEWSSGSAHGATRVLELPQIVSPTAGTRIEWQESTTVPVEVSAPTASGGVLALEAAALYSEGAASANPNCFFHTDADDEDLPPPAVAELKEVEIPSPSCWSPDLHEPLEWDSLDVRLILVTYDSTYMRYAELFEASGAYLPSTSVGIEGAMGFFASGAMTSALLRLIILSGAQAPPRHSAVKGTNSLCRNSRSGSGHRCGGAGGRRAAMALIF